MSTKTSLEEGESARCLADVETMAITERFDRRRQFQWTCEADIENLGQLGIAGSMCSFESARVRPRVFQTRGRIKTNPATLKGGASQWT